MPSNIPLLPSKAADIYQSLAKTLIHRAEQSWPGITQRCEEVLGASLQEIHWMAEAQHTHPILYATTAEGKMVIEFCELIDDNPANYKIWATGKTGGTHAPVGKLGHG